MLLRQRGSALLEWQVVAVLALLPLLMGGLQLLLLQFGSHVLAHATYQAARAGSVSGADPEVMGTALARGLMPLFLDGDRPLQAGELVTAAATARARAAAEVALWGKVTILAPSAASFQDHASRVEGQWVIRNDGLEHRPPTPGPRSGQSIQQANLLQIEARYCHPLVVPWVDVWLVETLRWLTSDLDAQWCYAGNRLPLRARVVIPMQSDLRFHGD